MSDALSQRVQKMDKTIITAQKILQKPLNCDFKNRFNKNSLLLQVLLSNQIFETMDGCGFAVPLQKISCHFDEAEVEQYFFFQLDMTKLLGCKFRLWWF